MSNSLPKEQPAVDGGLFLPSRSARPFFSTGCTMTDLLLGGGYAEHQIVKLRGESQAGKSLYALEAAANFQAANPTGRVRYVDRENAYDEGYVETLGIDASRIERPPELCTVEAVSADILKQLEDMRVLQEAPKGKKVAKKSGKKTGKKKSTKKVASRERLVAPLLYIVDSWDGLSDDAELARDFDDPKTYAMAKAKKGQELGRRIQVACETVPFTLIVVTQNRWKASKMPGLPAMRSNSGGSWLDYYPTQVLDLAPGKKIENTRKGHKREYGRWLKVVAQKNRRSGPQKEVLVPLVYRYGVCDLMACVNFLIEEDAWSYMFNTKDEAVRYLGVVWKLDDERYEKDLETARGYAIQLYSDIDDLFAPKRSKYGVRK